MSLLRDALDYGLAAARPTDNTTLTEGRLYFASDTGHVFRDNGATWDDVTPAGGIGGTLATTQVPYGASSNTVAGNSHLIYNVAGGGGSGGTLISEVLSSGAGALAGYADTGMGVDGEATGAGGWGVYGFATGAGGAAVVAEVNTATDAVLFKGLADAGQAADLFQLFVNSVLLFAVGADGAPRWVSVPPSSASDSGYEGTIAWDANYLYCCVAPNTWKRVAIATW